MNWYTRFRPSRRDDERAIEFERLMREHVPAFYRSAYRWLGNAERAQDLVQELLTRLYPKLDELRRIERIRPWATRVMYRIFVDELRRERSSPVCFGAAEADPAGEAGAVPIEASEEPPALAERQLAQERLADAWKQLTDEQRVVLALHDIEGYSLAEVSEMTETPVGTLKSRVHRARARLRDLLLAERFDTFDRV